jgi:hypothetical protein
MKLRYNLFFAVKHEDMYRAYEQYSLAERGHRLVPLKNTAPPYRPFDAYALYRSDGCWTLLNWCGGWEWKLRRQAQLYVSSLLGCPGLLVFVFGGYWGYELFNAGHILDHFVQRSDECGTWFPGYDCRGNSELFVDQFRPWLNLKKGALAAYLVQEPVEMRLGIFDFLSFLGLRIKWQRYKYGSYMAPLAPVWRTFEIVGPVL